VNTPIIYEFPLNERMRVFIRLEQLFQQFKHHLYSESIADKRAAISVLFDIVAIFKRNDLKSEILKELDRHANALKLNPNLNQDAVQLADISQKLYATTGKIGNHLIENELFQSIAQRSTIPGGTCSFDLPEFHYWLTQNAETCFRDLSDWSQPFADIGVAIDLILSCIRASRTVTEEIAPTGFFQITLDTSLSHQLLSVSVDRAQPYFVEISGGKHRCTIRFMRPSQNNQRPLQSTENIPFTLTRCIF
jgi:cell division protein ZapD